MTSLSPTLVRRWLDRTGDATVLGVLRVAIGIFLFKSALDAATAFEANGFFGDSFHLPFDLGFPAERILPSRSFYVVLLAVRLLLAVLITVGLLARPALLLTSLLGLYVLVCDRLQFHHNRYSLLCYAFLLAFTPCDKSWAIAGEKESERVAPLWGVALVKAQVSLIYLASGGSKLLDPDWRDGTVMHLRLLGAVPRLHALGLPEKIVRWCGTAGAGSFAAKSAITTELFLALALWFRSTRIVALWWGLLFHLWIEATAKVELFSWLTIAVYAVFVIHDHKARTFTFDASRDKGRTLARLVTLLDWFARFDIKPWKPDALTGGHSVVVIRRDGSRATGLYAFLMATRCLPLLFPLWAPTAFLVWLFGKDPIRIHE